MSKRKHKLKRAGSGPEVNGARLNAPQERLWRAAIDDLTSLDFSIRRRGHAALQRLESELSAAQTAEAVRRGIEDTVSLARARGEQVEIAKRPEAPARVRMRSRDGLETLERTGAISSIQYKAGLFYRGLYEATDPERDLRSQMMSPALVGAGVQTGVGVAEAWAERRVRLGRSIALLEDKVRAADRNGRAVRALREVAGHARCISHFVAGGGSQSIYRRALVLALDVCASHFGLG
jgi:hypothetical protein